MTHSRLLLVVACCAVATVARIYLNAPFGYWFAVTAFGFATLIAYTAQVIRFEDDRQIALRLWGFTWTKDEACCHFFVTGATGTGKTARAVVPIVHGLRQTRPSTGILAIDSKGALWKPLSAMARSLNQQDTLRLIRVRPTHIRPEDWAPPIRLNLLAMPDVPWTTYAKIIVDTATAAGQRGGQPSSKKRLVM